MNHPIALRLNQVTLATRDIDRAVTFYRRLGLIQIVASPHYARFVVPGNGATLSLEVVDEVPASGTTVYFECDAIDEKYEALRADGFAFDTGPVDQRWLWREVHLRDPDGNRLCIFHAGHNRLHPPWRLETPGGHEFDGPGAREAARQRAADEVRAVVMHLIASGSAFEIDALERIYHRDLRIIKIDECGQVSTVDLEENLAFFRAKRRRGDPPLSTDAEINHLEVEDTLAHVIVTRRMQLGDRPELSVFSIQLVHEDGRWQVWRETAFVRPLEEP